MRKADTGSDPKDFLVAPASTKHFRVRLESTDNGMLMSRATPESLKKPTKGRKKKTDPEPVSAERVDLAAIAADLIYRDRSGQICVPKANLMSCLRDAGREIPWGAPSKKRRVTNLKDKKTMLFSFLQIHGTDLVLDLPAAGHNNEGWKVDSRKGYDKKLGKKVRIIRPLFPKWALEFDITISFIGPEVTEGLVKKLFTIAGEQFGLGAFRVGLSPKEARYPYPFGGFEVAKFEEISQPAQQQTA